MIKLSQRIPPGSLFWFLATATALSAAEIVETDVCVYGGTSGGVIAAVQAARMGKSVVLLSENAHVGGMTSGGLGWTDFGNKNAIGGLSREFYRRAGRYYGQAEAWTFEPKVAEKIFKDWLAEYRIPVFYRHRMASVTMDGLRLRELQTENGNIFRARMFIDTTYEGDLMAAAGVTFTFGRESTNTYGESLNGIRPDTPKHQFVVDVDPYVEPGNPASGLLPYIAEGDGGTPGDGDQRLQAYNYRLCLTKVATNKIELIQPEGYDASRYELLGRYITARVNAGHSLSLSSFLKIDPIPNGKTDINNQGAFSTDFIGMNYTYATNTWAERDRMWREHEMYIRGLLWFLATDSRVPINVRTEMQSYGLCRDEFQDTGGWPHQLYVREARRMVSDYVMLQQNCEGRRLATDSIGLASYTMDSHNVQRIVQNGVVRNEGDVQVSVPAPYPISYRSIIPRVGECENLFVTFALSASHMGFGSCRMEPVFMITSQSAATAAALAINDNVPVQQLDYRRLASRLLADGQLLFWGSNPLDPEGGVLVDTEDPSGVVIIGNWLTSASVAGYHGAGYFHDSNTNKGQMSVTFLPLLPADGEYTVYLRWTEHANRATNVPVTITHAQGTAYHLINQTTNGGMWYPLGTYSFMAGSGAMLTLDNTDTTGYVVADAALWLPANQPLVTVEAFATTPEGSENGPSPVQFTLVRLGDVGSALTVNCQWGGTAEPDTDYSGLRSNIVFTAGQSTTVISLLPKADNLAEGDETVTLWLAPGNGYAVGPLSNATAIIKDDVVDGWRFQFFNPSELSQTNLSGVAADPDDDGMPNLWEQFVGTHPRQPEPPTGMQLIHENGSLFLQSRRLATAAPLLFAVEVSTNLQTWSTAPSAIQTPQILQAAPWEILRFNLGAPSNQKQQFWRLALRRPLNPPPFLQAWCFFSFDTLTNGNGSYTDLATTNVGFAAPAVFTRQGTVFASGGAGGASSFTNFDGVVWFGSGGSGTPGHSSAWNPGSVNNSFSLTFSTLGWRRIVVRFDIRSAQQAGGTAPTSFSSFTYNIGSGPQTVPGVNLAIVADNTFREWRADLSHVTALDNQPSVTLTWTFEDLAASPQESLRVDNILISAEAILP